VIYVAPALYKTASFPGPLYFPPPGARERNGARGRKALGARWGIKKKFKDAES